MHTTPCHPRSKICFGVNTNQCHWTFLHTPVQEKTSIYISIFVQLHPFKYFVQDIPSQPPKPASPCLSRRWCPQSCVPMCFPSPPSACVWTRVRNPPGKKRFVCKDLRCVLRSGFSVGVRWLIYVAHYFANLGDTGSHSGNSLWPFWDG